MIEADEYNGTGFNASSAGPYGYLPTGPHFGRHAQSHPTYAKRGEICSRWLLNGPTKQSEGMRQ